MTDDERKDFSQQLAKAVASRCHHIIHADDPIMTVAVILQVIADNLSEEQERMLGDYAKGVLAGTLRMQMDLENVAKKMLENVHSSLAREINNEMEQAMTNGGQMLRELIHAESGRALAAQRAENSAIRRAKQTAQIALAAAALSFMGGLTAFAAVVMR